MPERVDKEGLARRMMAVHNENPHVLLERFEEFFHPECEWVPVDRRKPSRGTEYRGKEGFRRWYAERNDALDEASVDIESCEEVREDVVLLARPKPRAWSCQRCTSQSRRSASCFAFEMG